MFIQQCIESLQQANEKCNKASTSLSQTLKSLPSRWMKDTLSNSRSHVLIHENQIESALANQLHREMKRYFLLHDVARSIITKLHSRHDELAHEEAVILQSVQAQQARVQQQAVERTIKFKPLEEEQQLLNEELKQVEDVYMKLKQDETRKAKEIELQKRERMLRQEQNINRKHELEGQLRSQIQSEASLRERISVRSSSLEEISAKRKRVAEQIADIDQKIETIEERKRQRERDLQLEKQSKLQAQQQHQQEHAIKQQVDESLSSIGHPGSTSSSSSSSASTPDTLTRDAKRARLIDRIAAIDDLIFQTNTSAAVGQVHPVLHNNQLIEHLTEIISQIEPVFQSQAIGLQNKIATEKAKLKKSTNYLYALSKMLASSSANGTAIALVLERIMKIPPLVQQSNMQSAPKNMNMQASQSTLRAINIEELVNDVCKEGSFLASTVVTAALQELAQMDIVQLDDSMNVVKLKIIQSKVH
jgi:hypothetical protein